jgi:galactokinase/mevalonate kinase-like predicted kinase
MTIELSDRLREAAARDELPAIRAYHRIDGPGSSLDLREYQQALWRTPTVPMDPSDDPSVAWSRALARTIAITIDTGTLVTAEPWAPGEISVRSVEYGTEVSAPVGMIPPVKENWLLKTVEAFGLAGVRFVLRNLVEGTHSSGLGGSATATTGVAMLANRLAGEPLGPTQIVGMASRLETELGVSLTGTQEQSNVVFGGVVDYVWCPWGEPGLDGSGYGASIRSELLRPSDHGELESRMAIFHTGRERASSSTNAAWVEALGDTALYRRIHQKLDAAYGYREGIRLHDWATVAEAIESFRDARTALCEDYMTGAGELHDTGSSLGGAVFPLGAGGGGGVLVFHPDPAGLEAIRTRLAGAYREVPFGLRSTGHEFVNV